MLDSVFDETRQKMGKSIEALKNEFKKIRTGRASLALFEGIRVNYYGTLTPLNQMASLSIPESRLVVIQPWDQTMIGEIEKEILKSQLGLTPMNDGKVIRIPIPPLTEERRKELVRLVRKIVEEHKVSIRNIRREANELLKTLKNDGVISEDDSRKGRERVQKITDEHILLIDKACQEKEKEILEF
ncbi:MAG: ribosome recycling factor [Deltaproteobacteria bacterium]|nr:ribosome recycling factor [Deltaproteobacteria bacterium]RLB90174.1 MAG: ribosome recycling factor [Deltaproteobacteria bacterium]RLB96247.1 MAG: ribosome recycling factor [Deltaproteobacteria bacterium]RLC12111.1 MAG: ribosome recycling factor [Deltaproteobacteria bacterium]